MSAVEPKKEDRPARLLIVEDEQPIREGLATLFEGQGYEVDQAEDGHRALERLADSVYELVVLDLMIPGVLGLDVLRQARASGFDGPVLILTAKGAEADVVAGLEAGADDYVTKPFGIHELSARVKALLRRRGRSPEAPRQLVVGEVTVDLDLLSIDWDGGQVRLTSREGHLLEYLLCRCERPVTRAELLVDVWGYRSGNIETRTVDVHVQQLRSKLADVPGGSGWIETVRGRGYRFAAEVG